MSCMCFWTPQETGAECAPLVRAVSMDLAVLRACVQWGRLQEEEGAGIEMTLQNGDMSLLSEHRLQLHFLNKCALYCFCISQGPAWHRLLFSSLLFMSLVKRKTKRWKEILRKFCPSGSCKPDWKENPKDTLYFVQSYPSNLCQIPRMFASQTRTQAVKNFTWLYDLDERIQ